MWNPRSLISLGILVSCVTVLSASAENLGRISFPNSGAAAAQPSFVRGVLLLHSFEYEDALKAFKEAQSIDPGFALAYWGEAMTYNHPLWRQQDRKAALEALKRLGPTPADRLGQAPTEREKAYLRTIETLYSSMAATPASKVDRDRAYSEALRRLREAYPDDLEAASFYALSILGTAQGVRDFRIYMKAAAVVEEVFDRNPRHPGALHYLIHSYDDPVHAPLGLRAARIYAEVAPAATHAQHMISHIYVALGQWDEVISSNTKSFEVSEARLRRLGQPLYKRSHHALHWLQYGLLQQGRYEEALAKVRIMDQDAGAAASRGRNSYLAVMQAAQVVETGRAVPLSTELPVAKISLTDAAAHFFAQSWRALLEDRPKRAQAALKRLNSRMDQSRREQAAQSTRDTPEDLQIARVLALELEALLLKAEGNSAQALERLSQAAALESSLPLEFGPPRIIKSAHEFYGELLLELDRPQEAEKQFAEALRRGPGRAHALFGLARSALANHNLVTAGDASRQLKSMWKTADSDLSQHLAELDRLLSTSDTVSGKRR